MKSHLKVTFTKVSDPESPLSGTLQSINGKIMLLAQNGDIVSNCISAAAMNIKPGESFKAFNLTISLPKPPSPNSPINPVCMVEYDIMYTKDKTRKAKRWCDGHLKYNESDRMTVFYDEEGKELLKKIMPNGKVREGEMLDTAHWLIEITARRINALQGDITKPLINNLSSVNTTFSSSKPLSRSLSTKDSRDIKDTKENINPKVPEEAVVEWNVVYTEDKHKKMKKKWLDGKLSFNSATGNAKFCDEAGASIFHRNLSPNQVYEGAELDSGRYQFVINELTNGTLSSAAVSTPFLPAHRAPFSKPATTKDFSKPKAKEFKVRDDIEHRLNENAKRLKTLNQPKQTTTRSPPLFLEDFDADEGLAAGTEESSGVIHFTTDAPPQASLPGFTSSKAVHLEKTDQAPYVGDGVDSDADLMALLGDGKPTSKSLFN